MILERIRQIYPQLTKSQRKLADFIAASYQEAAFMTASRMARRLSVNEATVIRFAQRLGYPGYPELVRDVQLVVQEELKARGDGEAEVALEEPLVTSLESELENLSRAVSHVSPQLAHQVPALVLGARRLYVAGQSASYHLAGMLAAGLADLGLDVRLVPGDAESLAPVLAGLESGDALIGIAATGETREVAEALTVARERGVPTLAVTWSPTCLSAQAAELAFSCPANDLFRAPSVSAIAVFLDAIVQAVSMQRHEGAEAFAVEAENIARRLGTGR